MVPAGDGFDDSTHGGGRHLRRDNMSDRWKPSQGDLALPTPMGLDGLTNLLRRAANNTCVGAEEQTRNTEQTVDRNLTGINSAGMKVKGRCGFRARVIGAGNGHTRMTLAPGESLCGLLAACTCGETVMTRRVILDSRTGSGAAARKDAATDCTACRTRSPLVAG